MDNYHQDQRPTTRESWDGLVREPLPPEPRLPRSPGTLALLSALAALLVVTVVGTTALVIRDLRTPASPSLNTTPSARATATTRSVTPTPVREPKDNGWTQATRAAGDVKFATSDPLRGYLCGRDESGNIVVGVTTDGGQTWAFEPSPAMYEWCSIQISPTNALDVVVNSHEDSCAAPCPRIDAHYSSDGGKTWKAAPIPQNTIAPGGVIWSGAYLYMWSGVNKDSGQSGFLEVSANGSPFVSLDLNALLPGASNVSIRNPVAGGAKLYLNFTYTGCSSQDCQAIVASGDGGKTWTQVPNQSNIQLMYVVGNTLYGWEVARSGMPLALSSDNGASWITLTLPALPNGQPLSLSDPEVSWAPTPDGAFYMTSSSLSAIAYLRAGVWTLIPFGPRPDGYTVAAVSLDANGRPQRVWGLIDAQSSLAGVYWHAALYAGAGSV